MGKPWIGVQLVADQKDGTEPGRDTVSHSLERVLGLAAVDAVIVRPSARAAQAQEQVRAIRDAGLTAMLWFPVLSDCVGAAEGSLTVNADGSRGNGRSGAWDGLGVEAESFLFRCPNDIPYLRSVRSVLESRLDELDVQGVMLDKIRFPSPANGVEALFSCFCDSCRSAFAVGTVVPLEDVRRRAQERLESLRLYGPAAFWEEGSAGDLAAFRARSVAAVVRDLAGLARSRSLSIGLDLFSPSLAPLVGQDYAVLSGVCDWVKPMIYRLALGPAGLPLEIACLWSGLEELGPKRENAACRTALEHALGWELPASPGDLRQQGLPPAVVASELGRLRGRPGPSSARVFAGIEAVDIPGMATRVSPRALESSLDAVRGRADGVVVSWDLLSIPDDNLRVLGSVMK